MVVRELSPELQIIAREELHEEPKRLDEDIQHVRDWISKQTHLLARTDDQWIVAILRGCKFSLERVKKKIDLYYTLRSTAPDITKKLLPTSSEFLQALRQGVCLVLPKSKTTSPRLVLLRPGALRADTCDVTNLLCIYYYMAQILVNEDDTATVVGTQVLIDYQGVSMSTIAQVNPGLLKKMIIVAQDSMPLRLKGSHHFNLPSNIEAVFTIVKSLISEKAKQRFTIHKSVENLSTQFPNEVLPKEYGGSAGTFKEIIDYWERKFTEYKEWMRLEEQLGTDETRRPGKPVSAEDMFGIEGSFRKLEID